MSNGKLGINPIEPLIVLTYKKPINEISENDFKIEGILELYKQIINIEKN